MSSNSKLTVVSGYEKRAQGPGTEQIVAIGTISHVHASSNSATTRNKSYTYYHWHNTCAKEALKKLTRRRNTRAPGTQHIVHVLKDEMNPKRV